ncbi:MAG: 2-oxoglutarate and iron-dependent oxygenase domain-containing protein [Ancalomicrobiaceae bacterium]|nr:2-oxoglutarate and iron-dependent oxygenase domain-containing protein [Ancalomicrobiaceae bacterium]
MYDVSMPRAYEKATEIDAARIPVIDLGPLRSGSLNRRLAVAKEIAEACETVGFFYIANHGVPQSLIDDAFAQNKAFFEQSREERLQSAATLEHWRGYVPSKLEGEGGGVGGSIETFRFMLDLPWDDPDVKMGKPLHMPNRYADHLPGFTQVAKAYIAAMLELGADLRRAFALGLGLAEEWFDPFYNRPLFQQSFLHYRPAKSRREEDMEIGAGEHRDSGAFTILMQDDTGGLEVGHLAHQWVAAPPIKGTYVINIGDMMMRWTNGRFVSTLHRVVNRAAKPRYSMPFFANPDFDAIIAPIPSLIEPGTRAAYEPLHFGSFMENFYNQGMAYLRK